MNQGQNQSRSSSDKMKYELSRHANLRMAQRNLALSDVRFAMNHGQRLYRTGIVFIFLGRRNIPDDKLKEFGRLEGTIVLMNSKTQLVITVYRNRDGLRDIKRKSGHSF